MTTNPGTPSPPDPFYNKHVVYVYPAIDAYTNMHPRHPDTPCTLVLEHTKGSEVLDHKVYELHTTLVSARDWDPVIETINVYYNVSGPSTYMVSIHNLSLIQRAAWWWSRRCMLPDPTWNSNHVQKDIVNHYNGPAIITAEERFNFNVNLACLSLGEDVMQSNAYKSIDDQFLNFKKLWQLVRS